MTTHTLRVAALWAGLAFAGCARSATAPTPAATNTPTASSTTHDPAAQATANTSGEAAEEFRRMSIDDLAGALERRETLAIYDNNARERYERGHIPGARWVGHDAVTAEVLPPDRNAKLVFYCANEH